METRIRLFRIAVLSWIGSVYCLFPTSDSLTAEAVPAEPPSRIETLLGSLDPFYKQRILAGEMPVVGSEKVTKYALGETAYLAQKVLANRPDLMRWLGEKRNMYICVLAYDEMQTAMPECKGQGPWADFRYRGQGGRPVSCAEENLLCYPGDPWQGENIFIHEFAHGIDGVLRAMDKRFTGRLQALYDKAEQSGRFRGYAIEGGVGEFWAEGVQAWFNCNGKIRPKAGGGQSSFEVLGPNGGHICHIATREQLLTHLPEYAKLLDESFGQNEWVYVPVAKRLDQPHLRGYDPAKAPTFRFTPEAIEAGQKQAAKFFKAERARQHDGKGVPSGNTSSIPGNRH